MSGAQPAAARLLKAGGHKYDHGHVLVVAGGPGHGGAARLAARAALRIGAGLVTLAPPASAMPDHSGMPDALMRIPVDDPAALADALRARRITAICLGPGCGVARAASLLPVALGAGLPCVLDADALTALADSAAAPGPDVVMTPHGGEFARMFPDLGSLLSDQARVEAARTAAGQTGSVMLLKGPRTVIAASDGETRVNDATDAPWLATAGSGDVLAGMIAGLLARGLTPLDAATDAAHIHAECARRFGPGLIADDLPELIPAVLRGIA
ncbi:NAD(P)H-hydrate dehydratase [Paracoccus aurantiacus]|uniref:ADP-dependent (S)-NAD(P)H-hydrate dehydratase n=1 Tax=Paracoccus aurantiacus TaxID=2599412 RepID=A0A5C6S0X6_9RHOB|nr:NAD(P)H-hydrate dehydratase [Paracoccus aurantiacus]TXB67520.1 NAD(P)H-hydrate dehydratase [Paracoccus aurantiacus]